MISDLTEPFDALRLLKSLLTPEVSVLSEMIKAQSVFVGGFLLVTVECFKTASVSVSFSLCSLPPPNTLIRGSLWTCVCVFVCVCVCLRLCMCVYVWCVC